VVHLEGPDGATVTWKPSEIGGPRGGAEVYRAETIELRAGDRIRWTRNGAGLGLVNGSGLSTTAALISAVPVVARPGFVLCPSSCVVFVSSAQRKYAEAVGS